MKILLLIIISVSAIFAQPTLTAAVPFDRVRVYYNEVDNAGNPKPMGESVYQVESYTVNLLEGEEIIETFSPENVMFVNDSTYDLYMPFTCPDGEYLLIVNEVYVADEWQLIEK